MPKGILITMPRKPDLFKSIEQLSENIAAYFNWIAGAYHLEMLPCKTSAKSLREQKVWDREPQPPTLSGLALHLGFDSLNAFEAYEQKGNYASTLKRARLRIEAEYEKQLHHQPSSGAIFALKSMGWLEQSAMATLTKPANFNIKIEIVNTGYTPALTEQEALL
jgi:hypothetical protein